MNERITGDSMLATSTNAMYAEERRETDELRKRRSHKGDAQTSRTGDGDAHDAHDDNGDDDGDSDGDGDGNGDDGPIECSFLDPDMCVASNPRRKSGIAA